MTEPVTTDIWTLPDDAVYTALGTSPQGLTEDEAFARLAKHGKNVLPAKVTRPVIYKFFDQFTSLFAIMLEVAARPRLHRRHALHRQRAARTTST